MAGFIGLDDCGANELVAERPLLLRLLIRAKLDGRNISVAVVQKLREAKDEAGKGRMLDS
jgi:hypothetical protein